MRKVRTLTFPTSLVRRVPQISESEVLLEALSVNQVLTLGCPCFQMTSLGYSIGI
jgi:hypothetical protein